MQEYELQVGINGAKDVPYNEPDYPVYAGEGWLHGFKDMSAAAHWHWDIEYAYVLSGTVSYTVNLKTVTIHEGEGIFINSGQIHRNFSVDGTDGEYRCVLIHPSVLQTPFQKAMQSLQSLSSHRDMQYIILHPEIPWEKALLKNINMLYESILSGVAVNIFNILSYAFGTVHTLLSNMPLSRDNVHNAQNLTSMREMMGYIQLHYSEKILVSDISRAGKVGNSTCHALFKKFLGISPTKYLLNYRLEKAADLLMNPNATVAEIAEMTGFVNPSYFTECFKLKYNVTPTVYRKTK